MKCTIYMIIISVGFFACSKSDNNNSKIENKAITKSVLYTKDTVLDGNKYKAKYIKSFDTSDVIIREGLYIKNSALGSHLFYKNGILHCKRQYEYNDSNTLVLLKQLDDFPDSVISDIENRLTDVNEVICYEQNKDTILEKSVFVEISKKDTFYFGEDIKIHFKYHMRNNEIIGSEILYYLPNNNAEYMYNTYPDDNALIEFSADSSGIIKGIILVHEKVNRKNMSGIFRRVISFRVPYEIETLTGVE